jgi:hypothetical protein
MWNVSIMDAISMQTEGTHGRSLEKWPHLSDEQEHFIRE